jgi:hypothetical protein
LGCAPKNLSSNVNALSGPLTIGWLEDFDDEADNRWLF